MTVEQEKSQDEELISQLIAWRHNRTLYPGWLIAPSSARERIWSRTNRWLGLVTRVSDRWAADQLLVLYDEVFWRLDVVLQYIPEELILGAERVLAHFENDIGTSFPADAFKHEGWPENLMLSSPDLRDLWITVACHVLRHFRVTRNKDCFVRLYDQIHAIAASDDDVLSRLAYDKCLWALTERDHEACLKQLNEWPTVSADPYWQVKRGALFAELGDFSKARDLMESSLVKLRSIQKSGSANIFAMSRESWTLRHLWQLSNKLIHDERLASEKESHLNRSRQRELEAFRCSAEVELVFLRASIEDRPKPSPQVGEIEHPPSFDGGDHPMSFRWALQSEFEQLSSALNFLMMIERTGLPPRVKSSEGRVGLNYFSGSYQQALSWISEGFASLWASWVMRFDINGLDNGKLSRHSIQQLPEGNITSLFSIACQTLEVVHSSVPAGSNWPRKALESSHWAELASRLSLRVDDENREWLLTIGIRLCEKIRVSPHHLISRQLDLLFRRTLPYLTEPQVQKWLVELLTSSLPIEWSEPLELVDHDILRSIGEQRKKSIIREEQPVWKELSEGISSLNNSIYSDDLNERSGAIVRMLALYSTSFLTDIEAEEFSEAVWSMTDEDGFPLLEEGYLKSLCLSIPEPAVGRAREVVLNWLDKSSVDPRFFDTIVDGETKQSLNSRDVDHFIPVLQYLQFSSQKMGVHSDILDASRAKAYMQKICDWWEGEGAAIRSYEKHPLGLDPTDRLYDIADVLGGSLLPKASLDDRECAQIKEMLDGFIAAGVSACLLAPLLASLNPNQSSEFQYYIQRGLASDNRQQTSEALLGFYRWVRDQRALQLSPIEPAVYLSVAFQIRGLIHPGVSPAINLLSSLIETQAIVAKDEMAIEFQSAVNDACTLLNYDRSGELISRPYDPEEVSHLRRNMARLISEMVKVKFKLGAETTSWLEGARRDVFVDVRRVGASVAL